MCICGRPVFTVVVDMVQYEYIQHTPYIHTTVRYCRSHSLTIVLVLLLYGINATLMFKLVELYTSTYSVLVLHISMGL